MWFADAIGGIVFFRRIIRRDDLILLHGNVLVFPHHNILFLFLILIFQYDHLRLLLLLFFLLLILFVLLKEGLLPAFPLILGHDNFLCLFKHQVIVFLLLPIINELLLLGLRLLLGPLLLLLLALFLPFLFLILLLPLLLLLFSFTFRFEIALLNIHLVLLLLIAVPYHVNNLLLLFLLNDYFLLLFPFNDFFLLLFVVVLPFFKIPLLFLVVSNEEIAHVVWSVVAFIVAVLVVRRRGFLFSLFVPFIGTHLLSSFLL
mmetsp:Transcript_8544/g.17331  ORF Transcript_8544/g.17331 Transcript_8544/m.17331 type:complete len:259 (+) Transcript_8544:667-1443(+)